MNAGPSAPPLALTLREKAAQLVMPWIPGDYWASDAAAFTAARQQVDEGVGGFIVSIGPSPYDIAEKLNALQRVSRVPLLIASDFESGPGARIREAPAFPGNMALGATDRELDAYEVGRVTALEGRAIGIHLNFAPVVDVNNNPRNPIINVRSFGENPARFGSLEIPVQASFGIAGLESGQSIKPEDLFARADEVEAAWERITPLLRFAREGDPPQPHPAGSSGPAAASAPDSIIGLTGPAAKGRYND